MEMESAGVYDAAIIRTPAPRTIAIRGISDYADARKDKIETSAKGLFRELAAKNALSLLIRGIEAGLFKADTAHSLSSVASVQATAPEPRVKSVFVNGGVADETKDLDAELPRLHNACLKLGKTLANMRERNLHDTSDLMSRPSPGKCPPEDLMTRRSDGKYNDLDYPEMGAAGERFRRNVPIRYTFPESEPGLLEPSPREVSRRLLARETFIPARMLNLLAACGRMDPISNARLVQPW